MARSNDRLPKLRAKHERFVAEYLVDLNGAAAAVRAGYSEKSARFTASELLARDDVQAHVSAGRTKAAEVAGVTRERVLQELAAIAFADVREAIAWETLADPETGERGKLVMRFRGSGEIPAAAAAAIAEVSQGLAGFKLKMHSKIKALELLAKHLRLLDEEDARNNDKPADLTPTNVGDILERARLHAVAGGKANAG